MQKPTVLISLILVLQSINIIIQKVNVHFYFVEKYEGRRVTLKTELREKDQHG
jgi:hypothetical protein